VKVPQLEGDQVRLTPLAEGDSDALFAWINDRDLVVLSAPFAPVERAAHDAWFDAVRAREDTAIFAVRLRDGNRLVGTCQLHSIGGPEGEADLQIRIGERDVWGRGVGREAVELLSGYGFGELGLDRIHLHVFASNDRAQRLYERCGFRREGVRSEAVVIEGRPTEVVLMAKLRSDHG
jgi:RimJ/RimL family protein N-acetyltransferase